ncbi:hypothetical protein A1O3_09169 [Capronia epimyces CBS 606.96]|uniref:SCP domain-containing protein n=1 Tax=Capronia epimyces CBS 606.96 TaxID=1182542 RepID=W9XL09_9EURO|nr:uncharacterized protein A1O3_09169 [Capronia epimyces CBS 606.96]EXJ78010.1 hypothetical protein A1O3_09169 [Capronia epimyces CBS 606.96]
MFSFKNLSVLAAVAGVAFALPTPAEDSALVERQWRGHGHWQRPDNVVWVTVTATADDASIPTATAAAVPVSTPASVSVPAAAPATPTADTSGATGYFAIVSKWRAAGGLPAFTQDSTLEANALKTATDSGGALKHELNPGTFAQVLAPGTDDDNSFLSSYVGGWLCEIPTLPGLNGICATLGQGWTHSDTGHADILTSTSYTKIGCANADGIWACDLS